MAKVIVYSAEWCPWCHKTIEYLKNRGVDFEVRDVEKKEYAIEAMKKSGQTGIPVIDINGKIIVGFNQSAIDEALKEIE